MPEALSASVNAPPHERRGKDWHVLLLLLPALALMSCRVKAPPRMAPDISLTLPDRWTGDVPATAESLAPWWRTVGGAELEMVITEALENNRDLRVAAARIEVATSEVRVAGADLQPGLNAGLSAARRRQNLSSFPLPGLGDGGSTVSFLNNSFGLSLNVSWEIDIWGRIRSSVRSAAAQLQAQQAEYAAARLSLGGQVAKAWFALAEAKLQVALAETTVASFAETATQARNRVEAGVQNPSDAALSAANLAQAQALLQERRRIANAVVRQLEVLLGRYPTGDLSGVVTLPALPPLPPAGVPAELVQRRPDMVAAERRLASAAEQISLARKLLYPSLSLTGNTGTASADLRNLLKGDFFVWSLAGNLLQPVLQGGRLRARIEGAEARETEALETFASAALTAFAEVETALTAETFLRDHEGQLDVASDAAREAVRIAENRYGQGVETILVVLEAQRRSLDAQSSLISVRREILDNRVDLYLALGGDIP